MGRPSGAPTIGSDVMARCHRSYVEAFWQWTKACPGATRKTLDDPARATLFRTSIPSSTANVVFLSPAGATIDPLLAEAQQLYGRRSPWRMICFGEGAEEVDRRAPTYRLRRAVSEPGMLLDPLRPAPAPTPGLSVRTVSNVAELHDFGDVWCASFRVPRWIFPLVMPSVLTDDPEFGAQGRLFVGYDGKRPVACSSVVVTERVANVVSVGTVPESRGRGYGASITWRAVQDGHDLGADVAYLAASRMGYPVYEKMGFRRAAEYPTWDTPAGLRQLLPFARIWWTARRRRKVQPARS